MKLEDREWKVFSLTGKDGLFPIHATSTGIDGIKLKDGDDAVLPYITRTETNNGIARFISQKNLEYGKDGGDCITIGLDTQTAYWQPTDFVTGQNIHVLRSEKLNYYSYQFITVVLRQQMKSKFNWGGNGATLGRLKKLRIMLPVTEEGEPDYQFMEDYVRELMDRKRNQYLAYLKANITNYDKTLTGGVRDLLKNCEWKPFMLASIFTFLRGSENNMAMLQNGNIPLISARNVNNGLKGFIDMPQKLVAGHCISLNNDGDGGAGLAYYQPASMALDTHVTALFPKSSLSMCTMLFISECLSGLHGFFGHGLSISNKRAEKIKIMLPAASDGHPDYELMEQVGKQLMYQKYNQYLRYLENGTA